VYRPFGAVLIPIQQRKQETNLSEDPIEHIDSSDPKPDPNPSIFDESREDELHKELGAIYDRNHAKAERAEELQIVPSILPGDSTQTAFEKTYDFLHASPQQQATQRDASKLVGEVRANAAKFGVTLDDKAAMEAAMKLEAEQAKATPSIPAELQPALKSISELYPNRAPHEVANEYAQIDRDFQRDPLNTGFRILTERTGLSPLEIARQVAMAHSPQHVQLFHAQREAEVVAGAFIAAYPDVDQEAVVAALSKIPKTGNYAQDLAKAYEMAGQRPSRPRSRNTRRSMESEMRDTWNRVNRR
jgi:hypothetical protein